MKTTGLVLFCLLGAVHAFAQGTAPADRSSVRPKVAIIMGGGGAHGVAHLGVLRELERQRVPVDLIVGTGFGGLIGGLYASGMSVEEIASFLLDTDWANVFDPDTRREDLSFRRKADDEDFLIKYRVGISDGQAQLPRSLSPNGKLAQLLQSVTATSKGISNFDDLPVPYRAVAMDLVSGEEVILGTGALSRAMLAGLTSPGNLPPVQIGDRSLITGGLINNLPVDVARELGAETVIVVDVGVYVRDEDDLSSIFAIVDQVGHLLQKKNSNESIRTLGENDILIRPDLVATKEVDVGEPQENFRKGEAAVAALAVRFDDLRMSEQQFASFNSDRIAKRSISPVISAISLDNNSAVDDAVILSHISQPLNATLDKEALENDIRDIYGLGEFSAVEFDLVREENNAVLKLRAIEKPGGNRFWRFGVGLQDDLSGNSAYTASASMTWTSLNRLGGEWRTVMRIGEVQQLSTEFYQPLVSSGRYFASIGGGINERNVNAFESGEIIGQARVEEQIAQLQLGRIFGNSGQVSIGVLRGSGETESNIGSDIPEGDFDVGGVTASAVYDTFDNVYFPKRGATALLGWIGQRQSMGASLDVDVWTGVANIAKTWDVSTLLGGISVQSQVNDVTGTQNLLTTGGLFQLSGFQRDELSGKHTGIVQAIYYRQLRSNPLRGFLEASMYAGVSLELGNAWQSSDEISLSNTITAGSMFLGADTFIGPVYLAAGLAEGGRSALYLYVGRPF